MSEEQKSYHAGYANYNGDVSHMVGECKGQTAFGTVLVAESVEYDKETDKSRVKFRTATDADIIAYRNKLISEGVVLAK